jgi:large subunit ribosomal protein L10
MALTKNQKVQAVEEISELLEKSPIIYITNYSGLSVDQAGELRSRFREMGVQYKVVKNTLLKRAMDEKGGFDELYDHLNGPTAVAFSEDPAAPARVIKKYVDDTRGERPQLKVAYIDGAVYQADALETLAALKSKEELVGDIVGLLLSPITNIVGGLQAPASSLVGAIKTIAEKAEA